MNIFKRYGITIILPAVICILGIGALSARAVNQGWYKHIFEAKLSGSEVAPAVASTTASGRATFKVAGDESFIDYEVQVNNGQGITGAHLNCADPGQIGPIITSLVDEDQPISGATLIADGTLELEDIMQSAWDCGPNIHTIPHLIQAMREGKVYVSVDSVTNPTGEIRGQLTLTMGSTDDSESTSTATSSEGTTTEATSTTGTTTEATSTNGTSSEATSTVSTSTTTTTTTGSTTNSTSTMGTTSTSTGSVSDATLAFLQQIRELIANLIKLLSDFSHSTS